MANFIPSPSTPNSYTGAYLTPTQVVTYYDVRTIGDLCSDTGVRLTAAQVTTTTNTPPYPTVQQLLASASGMVEAACLVAGRYQPGDLAVIAGLVAASNGVSMAGTAAQGMLFQLIADLFIGLAIRRRPDKKLPLPAQFLDALNWLEMLRQGERIFGLIEVQEAGNLNTYQELASDVYARNLIETQARRFFGRRCDLNPRFPNPAG